MTLASEKLNNYYQIYKITSYHYEIIVVQL